MLLLVNGLGCLVGCLIHGDMLYLQAEVQAPAAVRAVDLVDLVWPAAEKPRPEVQLHWQQPDYTCSTLVGPFADSERHSAGQKEHSRCPLMSRSMRHCSKTIHMQELVDATFMHAGAAVRPHGPCWRLYRLPCGLWRQLRVVSCHQRPEELPSGAAHAAKPCRF